MVNGAQDISHPYEYEDWNHPYWNKENSPATDRFSHNPSIKRQFLQLLGEGVPAALFFSLAGVSIDL